jgi:hypothetical protein
MVRPRSQTKHLYPRLYGHAKDINISGQVRHHPFPGIEKGYKQTSHYPLEWLQNVISMTCRPPRNEASLNDWCITARQTTPKVMRKGLATTSQLTAWMIYKQRSSCTFEGEHLSTRRLVDRIKTEATLWARAGAALPLGMFTNFCNTCCNSPPRRLVPLNSSIQWKETQSLCVFSKKMSSAWNHNSSVISQILNVPLTL